VDTKLEMARTTGLAALHRSANTQSIVFPAPETWFILRPSQARGALTVRSVRSGAGLRTATGPPHLQTDPFSHHAELGAAMDAFERRSQDTYHKM